MSVNWGSVPDWLAATGTVVAVVALTLASKDYRSRADEFRDNEAAQARLVTSSRDAANQALEIVNHSAQPIFNVEIEDLTLRADPAARWQLSPHVFGLESSIDILPAGGKHWVAIQFVEADGAVFNVSSALVHRPGADIGFDARVKFTDAGGLRWRRLNDNKPTRVFT